MLLHCNKQQLTQNYSEQPFCQAKRIILIFDLIKTAAFYYFVLVYIKCLTLNIVQTTISL